MQQTIVVIDDGDLAAEPAHPLREFQPDVAAAEHDQLGRNLSQFEGLDVGERLGIGQARSWFQCSPRTSADNYIGSSEAGNGAARERDFQSLRAYKAS